MRFVLALLLLSAFLPSCRTPELEELDTPVLFGVTADSAQSAEEVQASTAWMQAQGYGDLMLFVPLVEDGGVPQFGPGTGDAAKAWIRRVGEADLRLHLCLTRERELYLGAPGAEGWQGGLIAVSDSLLGWAGERPPQRLLLGDDFRHLEDDSLAWARIFEDLRERHPGLKLGYTASITRLDEMPFWHLCDEIALSYPATAASNPRLWHRDQHLLARKVADSLGLPLFIAEANLMGEDKAQLLRHRLSMWPPDTELEGITLNSLYPKLIFRDSTSYFGAMPDAALKELLREMKGRK